MASTLFSKDLTTKAVVWLTITTSHTCVYYYLFYCSSNNLIKPNVNKVGLPFTCILSSILLERLTIRRRLDLRPSSRDAIFVSGLRMWPFNWDASYTKFYVFL